MYVKTVVWRGIGKTMSFSLPSLMREENVLEILNYKEDNNISET